MHVMPEMTVN